MTPITTPRLVNTHDQLQAAVASNLLPPRRALAICVSYLMSSGTSNPQDGYLLYSPFFATDPQAAWYHHGQRWFGFHSVSPILPPGADPAQRRKIVKQATLEAAIDYCASIYDHSEWKRNRQGDWVPAVVELAFPIPKEKSPPIEPLGL